MFKPGELIMVNVEHITEFDHRTKAYIRLCKGEHCVVIKDVIKNNVQAIVLYWNSRVIELIQFYSESNCLFSAVNST